MRPLFITPLIIALLLILAFAARLFEGETQATSPLVGKAFPAFTLPSLFEDTSPVTHESLHGQYTLVNIFASWCLTCQVEHPFLMQLKQEGKFRILGINWKDEPAKALQWLEERGNPYDTIAADSNGQLVIELGVSGAPETFLVGPDGTILYRYAGNLTQDVMETHILPLVPANEKP